MNKSIRQFCINKLSLKNIQIYHFFLLLIVFGIPLNLYKNRFYDNSWTVGEWLINYAGGFVRRGLPGEIIRIISDKFLISPIYLVWFLSLLSLFSLIILLLYFCKNYFDKSFLLSQLIILAPISGDYLVRKDTLLVSIYGLSLLTFKALFNKKIKRITSILIINFLSILAILSHESYGIWGFPSLIIIFYIFEKLKNTSSTKSLLIALFSLLPSFISFILCWIAKGNEEQSLMIHQSWQNIEGYLPSTKALFDAEPSGAIAAIGWGMSQVYSKTLLSQFNLFIFWHPGMWLLTIFIAMRIFLGKTIHNYQRGKLIIICLQLITFAPMFIFVDIGRWIFMWLSSSALLFSFLINIFGIKQFLIFSRRLIVSRIFYKLVPGFKSVKNYQIALLVIGLPHCCWSVGRYIVSNPIGFAFKNLIFYIKLLFI